MAATFTDEQRAEIVRRALAGETAETICVAFGEPVEKFRAALAKERISLRVIRGTAGAKMTIPEPPKVPKEQRPHRPVIEKPAPAPVRAREHFVPLTVTTVPSVIEALKSAGRVIGISEREFAARALQVLATNNTIRAAILDEITPEMAESE